MIGEEFEFMLDPFWASLDNRINAIDEVIPGKLYLGDIDGATEEQHLVKYNIGLIITVCDDYGNNVFALGADRQQIVLPVSDHPDADIRTHFDTINGLIDNSTRPVLVHCMAGVSRSATCVLAYLLQTNKHWTVEDAYRWLKLRRKCINPNLGFMRQLRMYSLLQQQ